MRIIFIFYQPLVIVCRNQESRVKDFYTFMVIKIPAQYIKPFILAHGNRIEPMKQLTASCLKHQKQWQQKTKLTNGI